MTPMPSAGSEAHIPGPQDLVAGRYRLRSRIGGGGMGAVWLAHDQLLSRDVAVKQVISTEGLSEDTAESIRTRALREGRIAARLTHPNAIAMHDVALDRGEPWLVMEYLPSRSVAQILHVTRTLEIRQAAQIGAQVADAMTTAHSAGIIHRDIKPGNILVTTTGRDAGRVKITDFGISRVKDDVSTTASGVITGTPAYFAPEVARGADPDEVSDVYSLGATVYTLVEGQPPFGVDDDSVALLHKVARAKITPMTKAGELQPVLRQLLEPNPAKRPTMEHARDLLAEVAAGPDGSSQQVLRSPLTAPNGGVPVWARRSPRPGRAHTTGPQPRPVTSSPGTSTRTMSPTTTMVGAHPRPSGTITTADDAPAQWSGPSTATTRLALSAFAAIAVIALLAAVLIAVL